MAPCTHGMLLTSAFVRVQAVKAAEDAAIQAAQAAQQAEAGGNPVDIVAKATLATTRCSQVDSARSSLLTSLFCRKLSDYTWLPSAAPREHVVEALSTCDYVHSFGTRLWAKRRPRSLYLHSALQAAAPHCAGQRQASDGEIEPHQGLCNLWELSQDLR